MSRYFALARVHQPSMIVIEDVDLIARQRGDSFFEGTMFNILLNEMDVLREDSDVLVVLTTNHPEKLDSALASRPGRIDQAIEFPLPDEAGRAKLLKLYSKGLSFSEEYGAIPVADPDFRVSGTIGTERDLGPIGPRTGDEHLPCTAISTAAFPSP